LVHQRDGVPATLARWCPFYTGAVVPMVQRTLNNLYLYRPWEKESFSVALAKTWVDILAWVAMCAVTSQRSAVTSQISAVNIQRSAITSQRGDVTSQKSTVRHQSE